VANVTRRTINMVWIGTRMGPVHAACARSFMAHGHRLVLHRFDEIEDAPEGVEFFDATQLMRREEIVRYRNGSLALSSNIYRYRLLRAGLGLYVDCDVFCLRPFPEDEYLMGWERPDSINNAVLAAPADSPFLRDVSAAAENRHFIAPWLNGRRRRRALLLRAIGRPRHVSAQPWGTTGPMLITHMAAKHGLTELALPVDAFYPLALDHVELLDDPGVSLAELTTSRSYAIHLWHSVGRLQAAVPGSPLHAMLGR
jgi:hypothetical protein